MSSWYWKPHWRKRTVEPGGDKGSSWFDCRSIMLYDGIKLKGNACAYNREEIKNKKGVVIGYKTRFNKEISHEDARAVRRIY